MPIHLGKDSKGNFVQWGHRTKYYYTPNNKESLKRAKEKAKKQMGAIFANGYIGEEKSKFNLIFESIITDTINDIKDLKNFYKTCRYSLVDWNQKKCFKDIIEPVIELHSLKFTDEKDIKQFQKGMNLAAIASDDEQYTLDDVKEKFKICKKLGHKCYFITYDNKDIGILRLEQYKDKNNNDRISINDFAIFKKYQSQGLGKKSFKYILQHIISNYKNMPIQLGVAKINKIALNLYKSFNFKVIKNFDKAYLMELDKNEYLKNNLQILYHVSEKKLYSLNLIPRIPNNYLINCGAENKTTKRISFCPTIDDCLLALSKNLSGKELYVYAIETKNLNKNDIIIPTIKQVPDSAITHEIWVTKPVDVVLYGKLNILSDDNIEREYTYNDKNVKKTAKLYGWKYKLKQYDKFEDYGKDWKLLSPAQVIQYNCGICYDTAKMNDYYLTKWGVEHKNLFACTERNYNDYDFNDPTHTFTIYLDKKDNKWKWLEGSWESFKNNNFKSEDSIELINWILKALANESKLSYVGAEFKKFPKNGISLSEFGDWTTTLTYNYKQNPDGDLQKYALDEIADILNNPEIGYGYYDVDTKDIIDDNDENNPLPDSVFNHYKLQSFENILTYKLGTCWDCTLVVDKLLTIAGIKHLNIFLYGGGDQYTTHTTTIYTLDNKTWNWCDGSWHTFGSNDKYANMSSKNENELIKKINNLHQKTFKQKNEIYLITHYPSVGSTSKQFINYILKNGIKIEEK